MRVFLTSRLMLAPSQQTSRLPGLLDFAVEGRHDILVEPTARAHWEAWLERQNLFYAEMWRNAELYSQQRQSLTPSMIEIRVDIVPSQWDDDPLILSVDDAVTLLRKPLNILVEDETSDRLFLARTVPRPFRPKWEELLRNGSISLINLGGITHVERRLKTLREHDPCALRRSYILVDSDAATPWGDQTELGPDALKACRSAAEHGVPIHILARRMAENYIPPLGLKGWVDQLNDIGKQGHVNAFFNLPPERQHYHHLKDGLKVNDLKHYGAIPDADLSALQHPLGRYTWQAFDYAKEADLRAYGVYDSLSRLFQELIGLA